MSFFIIIITALVASGLTLFSGFGLGTILMPAFALFFPVEIAIALTATVHLLNNLLKLSLLGRQADWKIVLKFGLPALLAAFLGAQALFWFKDMAPLLTYQFFGKSFSIFPMNLIIAVLIIIFVVLEFIPAFQKLAFPHKYLPLGGALSGFLGGISGHQGALRSAFLIKCGLSKESFIATGVVVACLVDFSRLLVYAGHFSAMDVTTHAPILCSAILAAFAGVWLASRLLTKITIKTVQVIVSVMLLLIAIFLGAGII